MTPLELNSASVDAYLDKTIRLWLGLKRSQDAEIPKMPDALRRRFLRVEEFENKHRDQWGEWEHSFSSSYQEGKLWVPEVDLWVSGIRDALRQKSVPLEPLWPDGHSFAACLTHDVDLVSEQATITQKAREIKRHVSDKSIAGRGVLSEKTADIARTLARNLVTKSYSCPSTERTIEVALDVEKKLGVVSSFLFTAWPLRKYSRYDCVYSTRDCCTFRGKKLRVLDMMKIISSEGFDVGLHGSYYSATSPEMLREQKDVIEQAAGTDVVSTRQHWLHWNVDVTPGSQHAAGLRVDSSMGFNRNIGFRSGTSLPYDFFDIENQKSIPVLEIPPVVHEGALFGTNALEYDLEMSRNVVRKLIDDIAATNGCFTIVLHPHSFLDSACRELYAWVLEYCTQRNGWLTSLRGVHNWWRKREKFLGE